MTFADVDPSELLKREQERSAQLETYAADLNRTYAELRRHLHHMTVLHEVNTRIASALDPDEVLSGVLDSLNQLLAYQFASVYLLDLDIDAHQGDGVMYGFYDDDRVLDIDFHEDGRYLFPGTGSPQDCGMGAGRGAAARATIDRVGGGNGAPASICRSATVTVDMGTSPFGIAEYD